MASGWCQLTTVNNKEEALVIQSLLEGAGIRCLLNQEPVASLYGFNTGVLGEISIEVLPQDLEVAQTLLEAPFTEETPKADE